MTDEMTLKRLFEESFARWRERLAPYNRPVRIEFRDVLPKSPLGKVLHRSLRAGA